MDWFWFFLSLAAREEESVRKEGRCPYKHCHSHYQKCFHCVLSDEERQLCQHRILCMSLHPVHGCACQALFFSYNSQALITLTGFDHGTFQYVPELFAPLFDTNAPFGDIDVKPNKHGKMSKINAVDCLGQMTFKMMMTNLTMYLRLGCHVVADVLNNNEYAMIGVPSLEKYNNIRR